MFNVKVKNLADRQTNGARFENSEDANAWVANQKSKVKHFGLYNDESEYSVEIFDITAEYEAAEADKAARKAKKSEAKIYLKANRGNLHNMGIPELREMVMKLVDLLEL